MNSKPSTAPAWPLQPEGWRRGRFDHRYVIMQSHRRWVVWHTEPITYAMALVHVSENGPLGRLLVIAEAGTWSWLSNPPDLQTPLRSVHPISYYYAFSLDAGEGAPWQPAIPDHIYRAHLALHAS